jgi:UDP-sulfoquinovose synthase
VQKAGAELGFDVGIQSFPNPRVEMEEHYYNATNTKLRDLGLEPHYLGAELVQSMLKTIERHKGRVIERAIKPRTRWKPGELLAPSLSATSAS